MFARLFKRDSKHYRERGERHLAAGRFADARHDFEEALALLHDTDQATERTALADALAKAKNALAQLNLDEAEYALGIGEPQRAVDHLEMVLNLAEDVTLREKAENFLNTLNAEEHMPTKVRPESTASSHCGSCSPQQPQEPGDIEIAGTDLVAGERFELAIVTLPGDLPERYAQLGEEFAEAYLLALDGNFAMAEKCYRNLLAVAPHDILCCELAVTLCHLQRHGEAQTLFHQALALRPENPLANLSLVQLLIGAGLHDEAKRHLRMQIEQGYAVDQARFLLGDLLTGEGDTAGALAAFQALLTTGHAREAARRLVPLLIEAGRKDDAAGLVKRYLHSC